MHSPRLPHIHCGCKKQRPEFKVFNKPHYKLLDIRFPF
jgi:hypothetical protein